MLSRLFDQLGYGMYTVEASGPSSTGFHEQHQATEDE
jgi:hypothetical protein